jgi:hypothetical protein
MWAIPPRRARVRAVLAPARRRAIVDRDFAAVFEDEARITERWPVRVAMRETVEKTI